MVLAHSLRDNPDGLQNAFKVYEKQASRSHGAGTAGIRSLWTTYHMGGVDAEVRDQQFEGRSEEDFYDCLAWVWTAIGR